MWRVRTPVTAPSELLSPSNYSLVFLPVLKTAILKLLQYCNTVRLAFVNSSS